MKTVEVMTEKKVLSDTFPESGYVRVSQVAAYLSMNKSSVWRLLKVGKFPQPVKLSPRVTVWNAEDIRGYVKAVK